MTEVVPYARREVGFNADWLLDPAEIAQRIGGTDFVPEQLRNNPAAITAALLYGNEVGLGRMVSLAKIAVIKGRPTLAAEAQRALILAAGHEVWPEEATITRCTMVGRRRGSEQTVRVTWTMDDAKRANLQGKENWRMYPRQMLQARASAELARAVFPDVIGGLAATEEIEDDYLLAQLQASVDNGEAKTTRRRRKATEPRQVTEAAQPEADSAPPDPTPAASSEESPAAANERPEGPPAVATGRPDPTIPEEERQLLAELEQEFGVRVEIASDLEAEDVARIAAQPISDNNRKKLHATFRDKGIEDREVRLRYTSQVIGRELESSNDLTNGEAERVLEHLASYDQDDPHTWPLAHEAGGDDIPFA